MACSRLVKRHCVWPRSPGASVASLAFLFGAYIIGWRLLNPAAALPGFATLSCGMFFLGGIQLLCLGILGEYVARVHNEVKARPVYVVDRVIESLAERAAESTSDEEEELQLERDLKALLPSLPSLTPIDTQSPIG